MTMSPFFYRVQPAGLPLLGYTSKDAPANYVFAWASLHDIHPKWFWSAREPPADEILVFTGLNPQVKDEAEGVLIQPLQEVCRFPLATQVATLRCSTINLALTTSPFLGGRFRSQGPSSGEAFRDDILIPLLKVVDLVDIDFDGILGPTPGFFEEAFGGLIRVYGREALLHLCLVATSNKHLVTQVESYLIEAVHAATKSSP
jgi:hypothetical protein